MGESNVIKQRREKALALKTEGLNLYPNHFRPRTQVSELHSRFGQEDAAALEKVEETFHLAGRVMARRDYGKSTFFDMQDHSGQVQAYLRRQDVGAETYDLFKKLDIGDIVGLEGRIFRTRTGELTLLVSSLELVTKSLLPLPEKYHEINIELKYRQRYLDLIMNKQTREVFTKRTRIISLLRRFLENRSFIEVETPMMHPIPGGATARPFETFHHTLDMKLYLRVAPELYLKRLLVGGFNRVYELNRNFRNEGISTQHNPEFTMLEFYQSYASYEDLMDLTEEMFTTVARELNGSESVTYQGRSVKLSPPWARLTFHESLREIGGVPSEVFESRDHALAFCDENGIEKSKDEVHG
ncbi:MAG: lysine--tRNA ligase, partial [Deltaproteobacteria bacterium]|nr:lysine--tRNA ligase [Deltaproteobacteria bacterium]